MTRRGLLSTLLGAATLDPERLLWVPGAKVISIPAPRGISSLLFAGPWTAEQSLILLSNKLQVVEANKREYRNPEWKIGDTMIVRKPMRFTV